MHVDIRTKRRGLPRIAGPSLRSWWARAVAAAVAVAGLSLLLLPSVPTFDPFAWLIWGRELSHGHLDLAFGPSWKPLPVVFTTLFAFTGPAAPWLWLLVARGAAVLAMLLAFRIASRLAGRVAGAVALLGLACSPFWFGYGVSGASEPMLLAAALIALELHREGRWRGAIWAATAAALVRPEAWPFAFAYGVLAWKRAPSVRVTLVAAGLAIPAAWFGVPWLTNGNPMMAGSHAHAFRGAQRNMSLRALARHGADLVPWFVWALSAVGVCAAIVWRRRLALWLAVAGAGWCAVVAVLTKLGYPGLVRFLMPGVGLFAIVAGAGAGALLRAGRSRGAAGAVAAALAVGAVLVPSAVSGLRAVAHGRVVEQAAATAQRDLDRAIVLAGGRDRVLSCRSVRVNHFLVTALAWKLDAPLARVRASAPAPAYLFSAHARLGTASPPGTPRNASEVVPIAASRLWRVDAVSASGQPCPPRG